MDDDALLAAFEDASLPLSALSHRAHVQLAWIHLRREPFGHAGERLCASLRRYATAHGKDGLFHATITWAYLALVHERMQDGPDSFAAFAQANGDLLDHRAGAIRRHYDDATLASPRARTVFVLPAGRCGPHDVGSSASELG